MWQENLLNNLIVIFVLIAIFLIIYCKISKKTIGEVIKDIKGAISNE